jgi:hypothetical protein
MAFMIFVLLAEIDRISFIDPITGKCGAPHPGTDTHENKKIRPNYYRVT